MLVGSGKQPPGAELQTLSNTAQSMEDFSDSQTPKACAGPASPRQRSRPK